MPRARKSFRRGASRSGARRYSRPARSSGYGGARRMRAARRGVRTGRPGFGRVQTVRIVIDGGPGRVVPGAANVGLTNAPMPRRAPF